MPPTPEQQTRIEIGKPFTLVGWWVFDLKESNIHAAQGVAIREFQLNTSSFQRSSLSRYSILLANSWTDCAANAENQS
jgi:hypothetical protein